MKEPSIFVRAAGSPGAAIPLTLGSLWVIVQWTEGRASFCLALMAFSIAVKTIRCSRQRKRYKAWRKQWDAVGTFNKPRERRRVPLFQWATLLAVTLLFGIVEFWPNVPDSPQIQDGLRWLWFACAIFLVGRFASGIRQLIVRRKKPNGGKPNNDAAPVSCMLTTTLDSPSREMAVSSLPEYAARILSH